MALAHCTTPQKPTPTPQQPAPPKTPPLKAAEQGAPLPFTTFVAHSNGGAALRLTLSTAPITCDDFKDFGRSVAKGEQYITMTLAPKINTDDGTAPWQITSLFYKNHNLRNQGPVQVTMPNGPGGPIQVVFDNTVVFEPNAHLNSKGTTVTLEGGIETQGCGVIPRDKDAKPNPQPNVALTVAGREMTVRDARIIDITSRPTLVLSTGTLGCPLDRIGADVVAEIRFGDTPFRPQRLSASGDLLDNTSINLNADVATGTLPSPLTDDDAPKNVALDLNVAWMTVKGEINAKPCNP